MYLIVNKVVELEVVHIAHSYTVIELFTCTSVVKSKFTILCEFQSIGVDNFIHSLELEHIVLVLLGVFICHTEAFTYIVLVSAVEYRSHDVPAKSLTSHTEVYFKYLSDVHS